MDINLPIRQTKPGRPCKLSNEQVYEILQRLNEGASVAELAEEYGVSSATVYRVTCGLSFWFTWWRAQAAKEARDAEKVKGNQ